MSRLPTPGADNGTWGSILNDFLKQSHNDDGSLRDGMVKTTTITDASVTAAKLSSDVQSAVNGAMTSVGLDKQWVIAGTINVAAGDVDYIAPAYLTVPGGFTATITTVRARINSGTNVNLRINKNGSAMSGLSSVTVTTSGVMVTGLAISVADGDLIAPVVNSTSGGPQNMTVTVVYNLQKA